MPVPLYDVCVPPVLRAFDAMTAIIDKAAAHCAARKIEPAVLVNYRLAADMLPFKSQIQIMSDQAKGMASRLAAVEVPSYPDSEVTMDDLKARLAKTKAYVQTFTPEQFEAGAARPLVLKFGQNEVSFAHGLEYVTRSFLPNFFFHAATAYDILRHAGVELGKRDFLGK